MIHTVVSRPLVIRFCIFLFCLSFWLMICVDMLLNYIFLNVVLHILFLFVADSCCNSISFCNDFCQKKQAVRYKVKCQSLIIELYFGFPE